MMLPFLTVRSHLTQLIGQSALRVLLLPLGGPWYTEQEFDHEFVEELCNFIVQFVNSKGMIDLAGDVM